VKLVACPGCHAQYDVAGVHEETITCPCGTSLSAKPPGSVDAAVSRCAACGALLAENARSCSFCDAAIERDRTPAGPVCPECYARNPEQARHCTSCGVAFLPQPVRLRQDPLECPACPGARLAARSLGGLWMDECPMCLGLWAPADVMDRLVDHVRERRRLEGQPTGARAPRERQANWQGEVSYRRCPECRQAMQRKNFGRRSGVIVDWCGSHGTWLDADEMEDIAAFVLMGGLERAQTGAPSASAGLPADPKKAAALLEAERLLAEERARAIARDHRREINLARGFRGLGDLIEALLR
jgi:Zn-finger nucleic acid-binding protein/ribosomal protein L40E